MSTSSIGEQKNRTDHVLQDRTDYELSTQCFIDNNIDKHILYRPVIFCASVGPGTENRPNPLEYREADMQGALAGEDGKYLLVYGL
jgi:hypothetical protein